MKSPTVLKTNVMCNVSINIAEKILWLILRKLLQGKDEKAKMPKKQVVLIHFLDVLCGKYGFA
jgi:hypothetical protein